MMMRQDIKKPLRYRRGSVGLLLCSALVLTAATNGDARLVDAVKNRDAAQVAALLAQKANPNIGEPDGTTALAWAVRQDDVALVDKLLRAGANPQTANRYGVTPLYLACLNGNAQVVEKLLKAGADVNAPSSEGETPLMTVARSGHVEPAKVLLAHGADVYARETWHRQTALMYATAESHPEMMLLLIDHGALVNDQDGVQKWARQVTSEPRDKWLPTGAMTPLLFAARQGCVECAKILIEHGAEPNASDRDDVTPMISAIINGHYDVAAYLAEHGANPNLADVTGRTPLYAAVDCHTMPQDNRPSPKDIGNKVSSFELIELLIAKGADVNAQLKKQVPYRAKLDRGDDTMLTTGTTPLLASRQSRGRTGDSVAAGQGRGSKAGHAERRECADGSRRRWDQGRRQHGAQEDRAGYDHHHQFAVSGGSGRERGGQPRAIGIARRRVLGQGSGGRVSGEARGQSGPEG